MMAQNMIYPTSRKAPSVHPPRTLTEQANGGFGPYTPGRSRLTV